MRKSACCGDIHFNIAIWKISIFFSHFAHEIVDRISYFFRVEYMSYVRTIETRALFDRTRSLFETHPPRSLHCCSVAPRRVEASWLWCGGVRADTLRILLDDRSDLKQRFILLFDIFCTCVDAAISRGRGRSRIGGNENTKN